MPASLKRDMDLIRSLLLEMEGGKVAFSVLSIEVAAIIGADPADGGVRAGVLMT